MCYFLITKDFMPKLRILLLLICSLVINAQAKEYRVNSASAFTSAVSVLKPGDTVTILNGTYSNWALAFIASGDSTASILLRAESVGGVILTGSSSLKIAGKYLVADGFTFTNGYVPSGSVIEFRNGSSVLSSHCRLTNTSIIDYSNPDTTIDSKWVSIYGKYNRVDHCYLKGKRNLGTTLVVWRPDTLANYAQIDSNYFGPRPPLGLNGGETIRVGTSDLCLSDSYSIIERNYFDQCNGELEIISSKSGNNIYRYNTFFHCVGTLTLREANKNSVYGNYFFGDKKSNAGAIRIIGEDHRIYNNYITGCAGTNYRTAITFVNGIPNSPLTGYFQVKRAIVAFNTLVDNINTFLIGYSNDSTTTLPPADCVIANNIIYGTHAPLVDFSTTPINMTWKGNIFYGATTGFTAFPDSNYFIDPQFSAPDAKGIRHIGATSPAVNAAVGNFDFINTDINGLPRGVIKGIGAEENTGAAPLIRPIQPSDVGPRIGVTIIPALPKGGSTGFNLMQNYPNPFNPATRISFNLPYADYVTIKIYSVQGKEITTIFKGMANAGANSVFFEPHKAANNAFPAGVYFYKLTTSTFHASKKMVYLK